MLYDCIKYDDHRRDVIDSLAVVNGVLDVREIVKYEEQWKVFEIYVRKIMELRGGLSPV